MSLDRYQQAEKPSYPFPTWPRRARIEDHRKDCHGHLRAPELPDEQGALLVIVTDTDRVVVRAIAGDKERVRVDSLPRVCVCGEAHQVVPPECIRKQRAADAIKAFTEKRR